MSIDESYPLAQLAQALTPERIAQWESVIQGIQSGALSIGSRTPVKGTPAWVTLEVAHGGFATGTFMAGGALLEHEETKLTHLKADPQTRGVLNAHYLRPDGLFELREKLVSGKYRVDIPEEAALLVVAWLLTYGEVERAKSVVEHIKPYLPTLRFYPRPHETPMVFSGGGVCLEPVAATIKRLRNKAPKREVEAMREAITVWTPLYDRAMALVIETVEGEVPRFGKGKRIAEGGWPLRNIAGDWRDRVQALLDDHKQARVVHKLCSKPDNGNENYCRMRGILAFVIKAAPGASGFDVEHNTPEGYRKELRNIIAAYVTAHGLPDGFERTRAKEAQFDHATRPGHSQLAVVVADRLAPFNADDEGCESVETLLAPVTSSEATQHVPIDTTIPDSVARTARRCLQAEPERLVQLGLIPSADVLAQILPRWTARSALASIENQALRGLFVATYEAFRRRRSLLLLNLQRQVQLSELPWVAAISPWITSDSNTKRAGFSTLRDVALLTLRSFPHRIVPNPLVKELKALVQTSGLTLPLNEELAADIFMGSFSGSFKASAQVAARRLRHSLYSRYYGINYDEVLAAGDAFKLHTFCNAMIKNQNSSMVARNGQIIEQAQIVTTHNLASLVTGLELEPEIAGNALELAKQCFTWITQQEARPAADWRARLHTRKDCAYAFRQMVFYLSMAKPEVTDELLTWASSVENANRERVSMLRLAYAGVTIKEEGRFLGWATQPSS